MDKRKLRGPGTTISLTGCRFTYDLRSRIGDNESPGRAAEVSEAGQRCEERTDSARKGARRQSRSGATPEINCLSGLCLDGERPEGSQNAASLFLRLVVGHHILSCGLMSDS